MRPIVVCAAICGSVLVGSAADAQERGNPDFYVRVVPYLWLSNIDGQATIAGHELHITDTELSSDFAGRLEVGKGRLRGILELSRGRVTSPMPEEQH